MSNEKKVPEYQRLGIEPKKASVSLLHDEFGMPKIAEPRKKAAPVVEALTNEPVMIKAKPQTIPIFDGTATTTKPKRGVPAKSAQQEVVPRAGIQKNTIASIGNNQEHLWHSSEVTGVIDNNDEVDVESLQGMNTIIESNESAQFLENVSGLADSARAALEAAKTKEVVNAIVLKLFNEKNGVIRKVWNDIKELPKNEQKAVLEHVNQITETIKEDVVSVWNKFKDDDEDLEEESDESEEVEDEAPPSDDRADSIEDLNEIAPNEYAVIVDGEIRYSVAGKKELTEVLGRLMLDENLHAEDLLVFKRINIDFGVVLGD